MLPFLLEHKVQLLTGLGSGAVVGLFGGLVSKVLEPSREIPEDFRKFTLMTSDCRDRMVELSRLIQINTGRPPNREFRELCQWIELLNGYDRASELNRPIPLWLNYGMNQWIRRVLSLTTAFRAGPFRILGLQMQIQKLLEEIDTEAKNTAYNIRQTIAEQHRTIPLNQRRIY